MFFHVTQVRNCEDESRILNDLHRIWSSRERRVLVRSIKVDKVMQLSGLKCDSVEVKNYVNFRKKT
ncbi:hypothetical protein T01_5382 [Trichinella spiralis]|uniref:Uncharacterized protein n=1 Tax=Trichinella spiralis TaxID=6334 RepID=A0A0V1BKS6_TRISP|nr:hypothetical protein T01_5382 [Trichinella spiralis]